MSSTSSSRSRSTAHAVSAARRPHAPPPRSPRRRSRPQARTRRGCGGPTRAGARCTRAGCSPSSRNRSSPSSSGRCRCALPVRWRWRARPASWRRRTTGRSGTARSARRFGRRAGRYAYARLGLLDKLALVHHRDDALARGEAVEPVERVDGLAQVAPRAARPSGTPALPRSRIFASASMTLTSGRLCRRPTSKSLKSCAGVIFTAPEPASGSAYSSAMIGMRRPTSGRMAFLPTRSR